MTHRHQLAPTTHTLEMRQVAEINQRLAASDRPRVSAVLLRLAGEPVQSAPDMFPSLIASDAHAQRVLPAQAMLNLIEAEGSPDFPYLMGHFFVGSPDRDLRSATGLVVPLHSGTLRQISDLLGLRHSWGFGD